MRKDNILAVLSAVALLAAIFLAAAAAILAAANPRLADISQLFAF